MTERIREYDTTPPEVEEGDTLQALLIRDGEIDTLDLPRDAGESVRDLIGNHYTSCLTVPLRGGHRLVGYCDDEFLLKDPDAMFDNWNVAIGLSLRLDAPYPIGGPVVIVAVDPFGEARSMTKEESDTFYLHRFVAVEIRRDADSEEVRVLPILDAWPI